MGHPSFRKLCAGLLLAGQASCYRVSGPMLEDRRAAAFATDADYARALAYDDAILDTYPEHGIKASKRHALLTADIDEDKLGSLRAQRRRDWEALFAQASKGMPALTDDNARSVFGTLLAFHREAN